MQEAPVDNPKNVTKRVSGNAPVEEYFAAITAVDRNVVVAIDESGMATYISPASKPVLGFESGELLGTPILELVHDDNRVDVKEMIFRAMQGSHAGDPQPIRVSGSDGRYLVMDIVTAPLARGAGAVIGLRDVTSRVNAQIELDEAEQQLKRAQRVARIATWEMNLTTGELLGSDQLFEIYGIRPRATVQFEELKQFFHPADTPAILECIRNAEQTMGPVELVHRLIRADGEQRILRVKGETELYEGDVILFGTAHDITESHRLHQRLEMSESGLRNLMRRLHVAQENERKRLAREVHDVLGQAMTALRLDISWIQRSSTDTTDEFRDRVADALELVETTIVTIRRISHELRPGILDHFGLPAALEWQSEQFEQRSGLKCTFKESAEGSFDDLDDDLAIALFRIYQEALTNVVRHADASSVAGSLRHLEAEGLEMTITDNGKGLGDSPTEASTSLGLLNMRERVLPWGGTVKIQHADGHSGTTVCVRVPLRSSLEK